MFGQANALTDFNLSGSAGRVLQQPTPGSPATAAAAMSNWGVAATNPVSAGSTNNGGNIGVQDSKVVVGAPRPTGQPMMAPGQQQKVGVIWCPLIFYLRS